VQDEESDEGSGSDEEDEGKKGKSRSKSRTKSKSHSKSKKKKRSRSASPSSSSSASESESDSPGDAIKAIKKRSSSKTKVGDTSKKSRRSSPTLAVKPQLEEVSFVGGNLYRAIKPPRAAPTASPQLSPLAETSALPGMMAASTGARVGYGVLGTGAGLGTGWLNWSAETPCAKCPVFDFCREGGPVNPSGCVYYEDWMARGVAAKE
jgi:DNA-directed RNA polymerase III subunit RPC6